MANIKSQIKRNKTNIKATERNRAVKSEVKTTVRSAREAIKAGDKPAALSAVKDASRKLDKAVSKGVLHKNQAANRKSALSKQAAALYVTLPNEVPPLGRHLVVVNPGALWQTESHVRVFLYVHPRHSR